MTLNFLTDNGKKILLTAQTDAEKVIFADFQKNGGVVNSDNPHTIEILETSSDARTEFLVKKLILSEAFKFNGTGGNDGVLGGASTGNVQITDEIFTHKGWDFLRVYGGLDCIKMGTASAVGHLTTPPINPANKRIVLKFRAVRWTGDKGTVLIEAENARITSGTLIQTDDQWTDYSVELLADKNARVTLRNETNKNRVFIDDLRIYDQITD
jgi:hypothetical protein